MDPTPAAADPLRDIPSSTQIEELLASGGKSDQLRQLFGESLYTELQQQTRSLPPSRGMTRALSRRQIIIIPGILGSTIGYEGNIRNDAIWIDLFAIRNGKLREISLDQASNGTRNLDVVWMYVALKLRLEYFLWTDGYGISYYDYDWRKSIDENGLELANAVKEKVQGGVEEIYIVAHSMGGLVCRAMLASKDQSLSKVKRVIQLGTPNRGAFGTVEVFAETNESLKWVDWLDSINTGRQLIDDVFSSFHGLMQLLPHPKSFSDINLFDVKNWSAKSALPRADVLKRAEKVIQNLPDPDKRFCLIAGTDQPTVVSLKVNAGDLVGVVDSKGGDGTVPLAFAEMPKLDTFYIAETHNGLVSNKDVAKAVVEIIRKGTASNLTRRSIRERGKIAEVSLATAATRQSRSVAEQSPPALFENLMTGVARDAFTMPVPSASLIGETTKSPASQAPPESNSPAEVTTFLDGDDFSLARLMIGRLKSNRLDISLAHGSIIDVTSRAYVFGVYKGVAPSGPANEIDQLLGGAISNFYERRAFGGEAGQIFMIPTLTFPCRCELVVLVGLGSFEDYLDGKRGSALRSRVAMELVQSLNRMGIDEFATVLWGGATAERQKLRLILADLMKGFVDAYKDIPVGMLRLRRIILCEYDVDIFKSIRSDLLSLSLSEQFNEQEFTLDEMKVIPSSKVHESVRASQERQRDRVYLMATKHEGESSSPDHVSIDLRVLRPSFKGAMPTRTREFSKREINDIVARVRGGYSPADAQKLTELVLDKDTHNFLASAMDLGELNDPVLIVMHDLATAIIPWELLSNSKPWAIAHGISRLAIMDCSARFLAERRRDPKLKILLVLSDPFGDLAGGRKEFEALKSMFFERFPDRIECRSIQGNDAVKDKLFDEFNSGRYDVVHYIGHAQFDVNDASRRGIYCFDQKFLTGEDIKFAQHLPTLVFLNGCESGRTRSLERMREAPVIIDPVQLAKEKPSIALGFLQGGITQFIGTYWPVGDASALDFAHELYGKLLDKTAIGEAICTARQKLYEGDKGNQQINSDWANYIHYGDPSFAIKVDSDVGSA